MPSWIAVTAEGEIGISDYGKKTGHLRSSRQTAARKTFRSWYLLQHPFELGAISNFCFQLRSQCRLRLAGSPQPAKY